MVNPLTDEQAAKKKPPIIVREDNGPGTVLFVVSCFQQGAL